MFGFLLFALIIFLLGLILNIVFNNTTNNKKYSTNQAYSKRTNIYAKKIFLTPFEKVFLSKLKPLEQELDVIIIPQVNLASVIEKVTPSKFQTELFRNIDFGIFNSNYDLLLLIELNDQSHNQSRRRKRDVRVKEICKNAGIRLISFYTSYENEQHYVINRVKTELDNLKQ